MILGRVLDEFCEIGFEGDHGERFTASFSAGVATYPDDGVSLDELFGTADARLYAAKEAGRRRIEID